MRSLSQQATWLAFTFTITTVCAQTVEEADDGTLRVAVNQPVAPVAPMPVPQVAAKVYSPVITPAPAVQHDVVDVGSNGDLTIAITNSYGQPLSLAFDVDAGSSAFRGAPQPTSLAAAAATSYAVPSGWAGRVNVGKIDHPDNSKIEGSFYGAGNGDIDISYVDGYSVPITCSVGGTVVSGCNMELFDQNCNSPDTPSELGPDGKPAVCSNGARANVWGPPSSFFARCAGAAYTFPNDNDANTGMITDTLMSCCVGTSCAPSPHQKAQKRDIQSPRANAPSLLPRSHKRHARLHSRSGIHGHKHSAVRFISVFNCFIASIEMEDIPDTPPDDIDPYATLNLDSSANASDIKTAYKKLALRHHPGNRHHPFFQTALLYSPTQLAFSVNLVDLHHKFLTDKAPPSEKSTAHGAFQKVAFAYAILSSPRRRNLYNTTGSTSETLAADDDDFDWLSFFRNQYSSLSASTIKDFSTSYKHSDEERKDVLAAYTKYEGKMAKVYEEVMLSDPLEDEARFRELIDQALEKGEAEAYDAYVNETKKSKDARMKKARREAADAEKVARADAKYQSIFGGDGKGGRNINGVSTSAAEGDANGANGKEKKVRKADYKGKGDVSDLAAMIQSRQQARSNDFFDKMEAKYADVPATGKGKKRKAEDEPSEEAFERNAAKMAKARGHLDIKGRVNGRATKGRKAEPTAIDEKEDEEEQDEEIDLEKETDGNEEISEDNNAEEDSQEEIKPKGKAPKGKPKKAKAPAAKKKTRARGGTRK
ncbi:MAG: hypothetical protein Q9170_001595 [Blastenia crenularia]